MKKHVDSIKELRFLTSASITDCKKALEEAEGDIKKAQQLLRKLGLEIAAKKQERHAKEGRIEAYVHHGNKIGVLLEVSCETDFVARNSDFAQFVRDVAMQIAAVSPTYIKREEVPEEALRDEKDKEKFYKEHCLLEQAFVKDPSLTVNDCLGAITGKLGEKIVIRRFVRYKVGE